VHAVQLEMSQDLYMDETAPFAWRMERAAPVRSMVQASVEGALRAVSGLSSRISEAALPG